MWNECVSQASITFSFSTWHVWFIHWFEYVFSECLVYPKHYYEFYGKVTNERQIFLPSLDGYYLLSWGKYYIIMKCAA